MGRYRCYAGYGLIPLILGLLLACVPAATDAPTPQAVVIDPPTDQQLTGPTLTMTMSGQGLEQIQGVTLTCIDGTQATMRITTRSSRQITVSATLPTLRAPLNCTLLVDNTAVGDFTLLPAPVPTPTATAAPTPHAPQVAQVQPTRISLTRGQGTIEIEGSGLDQLPDDALSLVPQVGPPLEFVITQRSDRRLTLRLAQRTLDRAQVPVSLQIAGQDVATFTLLSGNPEYTVAGVRAEYAYTQRVSPDGSAALLVDSTSTVTVGMVRNGDQVEVLDSSVAGWFQVRVIAGDSVDVEGWIERWLILNADVPPRGAPSPTPPIPTGFVATVEHTYVGVLIDRGTNACVRISVRDQRQAPIAGAAGNVNNGTQFYSWSSDTAGEARVCGLGFGPWIVNLMAVPARSVALPTTANPLAYDSITLSGAAGEEAIVRFDEQ